MASWEAFFAAQLAVDAGLEELGVGLMSIFGAPARTTTPTPHLATSTRLSAATLPCLMRPSIWAAGSITTSAVSPCAVSATDGRSQEIRYRWSGSTQSRSSRT